MAPRLDQGPRLAYLLILLGGELSLNVKGCRVPKYFSPATVSTSSPNPLRPPLSEISEDLEDETMSVNQR